jgi:hypothetical protein
MSEYNGWTNYETWNFKLWLDNDGSDEYWKERAEDIWNRSDEDDEDRSSDAVKELENELEHSAYENMPEVGGFYGDVLGASIREVNWREIAEHILADAELDGFKGGCE